MNPNTPMTTPSHHASPVQIEDPIVGGCNVPPGYWANKACRCEWSRGRRQAQNPGTLLYNLRQLPLQREPTVKTRPRGRVNQCHEGSRLWSLLGHKKANIEAINAQSTGVLFDGEATCANCAGGDGIFDGCVQVPGHRQCANCHFGDQAHRCSLHAISSSNLLTRAIARRDALRQQQALLAQELALVEQEIQDFQTQE